MTGSTIDENKKESKPTTLKEREVGISKTDHVTIDIPISEPTKSPSVEWQEQEELKEVEEESKITTQVSTIGSKIEKLKLNLKDFEKNLKDIERFGELDSKRSSELIDTDRSEIIFDDLTLASDTIQTLSDKHKSTSLTNSNLPQYLKPSSPSAHSAIPYTIQNTAINTSTTTSANINNTTTPNLNHHILHTNKQQDGTPAFKEHVDNEVKEDIIQEQSIQEIHNPYNEYNEYNESIAEEIQNSHDNYSLSLRIQDVKLEQNPPLQSNLSDSAHYAYIDLLQSSTSHPKIQRKTLPVRRVHKHDSDDANSNKNIIKSAVEKAILRKVDKIKTAIRKYLFRKKINQRIEIKKKQIVLKKKLEHSKGVIVNRNQKQRKSEEKALKKGGINVNGIELRNVKEAEKKTKNLAEIEAIKKHDIRLSPFQSRLKEKVVEMDEKKDKEIIYIKAKLRLIYDAAIFIIQNRKF